MAEFLEKRAQGEALRYLRTQLKQDLCESDGGAKRPFFGNVCDALDALKDDASLQSIGSYMRAAAEKDLQKLPDVAMAYAAYRDPALTPVAFSGRLGFSYFKAAKSGRAPLEILWSIGGLDPQPCEASNCWNTAHSVRLASAVAYALRQEGPDWEKGLPSTEPKFMPVYAVAVALLAEQRLFDTKASQIRFTEAELYQFAALPAAIAETARALALKWKDLQASLKNDKLSPSERRDLLLGAIAEGISGVSQLIQDVEPLESGTSHEIVTRAVQRLRALGKVALDLSERRYGEATVAVMQEFKDTGVTAKLPKGWGQLVPFLVELASAQSSNDVAATFDAYAAPLGTYELKYEKPMITINGFLGGFAGWERTHTSGLGGSGGVESLFAPIGVHGTLPVVQEYLHLGILLSVLDLGAITTFRNGDEPTGSLDSATDKNQPVKADQAPQIGLDQVFSPGAYFTIAPIHKSPLVVGVGLSMSPKLRHVTQGAVSEDVSVLRYGFFFAADVPILPLN
jgi:hypothetical protein